MFFFFNKPQLCFILAYTGILFCVKTRVQFHLSQGPPNTEGAPQLLEVAVWGCVSVLAAVRDGMGPAELKPDSKRQRQCFLLTESISRKIYQAEERMWASRQVMWNQDLKNAQDIKLDAGRDRTIEVGNERWLWESTLTYLHGEDKMKLVNSENSIMEVEGTVLHLYPSPVLISIKYIDNKLGMRRLYSNDSVSDSYICLLGDSYGVSLYINDRWAHVLPAWVPACITAAWQQQSVSVLRATEFQYAAKSSSKLMGLLPFSP